MNTESGLYTHKVWEDLKNIAQNKQARILCCEGTDERVLRAVEIASREKLARMSIIGDKDALSRTVKELGVRLPEAACFSLQDRELREAIAAHIYEQRKNKGVTREQAVDLAGMRAVFGFGLLALGKVDGVICGAVETTAETVRSALCCLKPGKGHKVVTGLFLVEMPHARSYGDNGAFIFSDCGVTPDPSPRMLAYIGAEAADAFSFYFHRDPRVAFLSFSTFGSAVHERVDRIREAVQQGKKLFPRLVMDGELQLDAAVDRGIAERKGAAHSPVAGSANVLIFPDLDAGNIVYKAVQRFGNARTIGPVLWGLEKPASDLSRGCSVDDIVCTIITVAAQC